MGFYPKNGVHGQFPTLDDTALKTAADAALADAVTRVTGVYAKFSQTPPVFTPNEEDGTTGYSHSEPSLNLNIYYFHPDHLGSSAYISNAAGVVTQHMEYLPFGETLTDEHTNSFNSPFKYNGKEFDEETGNYYYGARYYDPKWSIFISVDPLAEKTMDAYGYCYQNPINLTDPDGRAAIWKPGRNGNLIAEKGDNAATLAKFLGTTATDVGTRFKKNGQSIGANHQFKVGEKVDLNNNMTAAINRSAGVSAAEYYIDGKTPNMDTKNDGYMCQESVISGSKGGDIGNANTKDFSENFKEVKSFDELSFGEGAVYIRMENGEEHYMLPYGKSQDGTPYVFSKEGNLFKPGVYPLGKKGGDTSTPTAVNFQRAINNSEVKEIKYYKYVGKETE